MIAHTSLAVSDYQKSKTFYVRALAPLGYRNNMEYGEAAGFNDGRNTDFWISEESSTVPTHVAFEVSSSTQVEAFHKAAMAAGGRDNGAPGYRDYWPGYYAAFVLDPDGNNIEAVWYDYSREAESKPRGLPGEPFPAGFDVQTMPTNGTRLQVRAGGTGPAVVLLHGFGDTGDMWAPLAADLVKDHRVIVPDLRGMGLSAHADSGYTKKNQAADIAGIMDALKVDQAALVTHDIGNMVGYALAAQYPARIARWVVIDAPLPGIGNWDSIIRSPLLWHFNFRGPDAERLVQGRERIYLDRFWNELSADPKKIDEPTREHYASLYARPHAMHDAFEQFAAFTQDAADNQALLARVGKLGIPVLALGAEKSFGEGMAAELRFVASDVTAGVIPRSGHWVMEENPQATVRLVTQFLR